MDEKEQLKIARENVRVRELVEAGLVRFPEDVEFWGWLSCKWIQALSTDCVDVDDVIRLRPGAEPKASRFEVKEDTTRTSLRETVYMGEDTHVAKVLRYRKTGDMPPYLALTNADIVSVYAGRGDISMASRFEVGEDICKSLKGVCELPGELINEDSVTPEWLDEHFVIETWEFKARRIQ